jgi:hypothetical protein
VLSSIINIVRVRQVGVSCRAGVAAVITIACRARVRR